MIGRKTDPDSEQENTLRGFDSFELKLGDIMRGERATMGKSLLDVQRDLKIKATYIAAIENSDPTAFETKGFIAGYVRSYARYLNLDPDWAYETFCEESAFDGVNGGLDSRKPQARKSAAKPAPAAAGRGGARATQAQDPLATARTRYVTPQSAGLLSRLEPAAIGSSLVLLGLIGVLGYGGWAVLQEIQRVQFAPVEQAPGVVATLDPLDEAVSGEAGDPVATQIAGIDSAPETKLERLYRPQELDVPVLVARDGPISTLDPDRVGALIDAGDPRRRSAGALSVPAPAADPTPPEIAAAEPGAAPGEVQVTQDVTPEVEIFAVRPAWVRVTAPDGNVIFEKILDAGERYALPEMDGAPRLRAGNSGSVYFTVGAQVYGPAGPGTSVAKQVSLAAADIADVYQVADLPPEAMPEPRPSVAENRSATD